MAWAVGARLYISITIYHQYIEQVVNSYVIVYSYIVVFEQFFSRQKIFSQEAEGLVYYVVGAFRHRYNQKYPYSKEKVPYITHLCHARMDNKETRAATRKLLFICIHVTEVRFDQIRGKFSTSRAQSIHAQQLDNCWAEQMYVITGPDGAWRYIYIRPLPNFSCRWSSSNKFGPPRCCTARLSFFEVALKSSPGTNKHHANRKRFISNMKFRLVSLSLSLSLSSFLFFSLKSTTADRKAGDEISFQIYINWTDGKGWQTLFYARSRTVRVKTRRREKCWIQLLLAAKGPLKDGKMFLFSIVAVERGHVFADNVWCRWKWTQLRRLLARGFEIKGLSETHVSGQIARSPFWKSLQDIVVECSGAKSVNWCKKKNNNPQFWMIMVFQEWGMYKTPRGPLRDVPFHLWTFSIKV